MSVYIDNFETIFGVKNNIQALRNKVLELAIQGKLVEQDTNDEPAPELLKKIQNERDKLVKEGKLKKQKSFESINEDEIPFGIPDSWKWVRAEDIIELISGRDEPVFDCNDQGIGIPYVMGASNIDNGSFLVERWISLPKVISKKSDLVVTVKGTVGKYFINNYGDINLSRQTMALRPYLNEMLEYITLWFKTYISELNSKSIGIIPGISREHILGALVPISPLAEQHRIVTKIESLMSEIDKLEEALQKKEYLMELLPKAVVDAIGSCQTGEELKGQLQFVIENFETIFQTPESMQELRNVVLQLAIEGKLVPQDTTDESALELVKRIQVEKDKLEKEGKIKKQQPFKPIEQNDIPFEIPDNWKWVRFAEINKLITCGYASTPTYVENGMPFISAKNIKPYKFMPGDHKLISTELYEKLTTTTKPEKNDILLTRIGAGIGESAIVDIDMDFAIYVSLTLIKPCHNYINARYILNWLNSPVGVKKAFDNTYGENMSQGNLNVKNVKEYLIPLPPLNEQNRIVEKTKLIMDLIEQMENELKYKVDLVKNMVSV